jgi:hypothetical protein
MKALFLSASVPVKGRGDYYKTAQPFLIQAAVRELVTVAIGRRLIVWGGHPAITPMVLAICEDLGVDRSDLLVLYQSKLFEKYFPKENDRFQKVELVDAVADDRDASLLKLRTAMLSRQDLACAIFIGGMEGVLDEYKLFKELHPSAAVVPVPATGGAALELAVSQSISGQVDTHDTNFHSLFYSALEISPNDPRFLANS